MKKIIIILIMLICLPMVFAGTLTRSISPASPSAGSTVTVTLTYTSSSGDKAITIHDESPYTITGTSSNIFEAARIHATQLASFTETYTFTIPAGTTGQKTFTGKYNINNQGDQVLNGASPFTIGGVPPTSCSLPWGGTINSGQSITAYQVSSGTSCPSQTRTCTNGVLSGTYQYGTCTINGQSGTLTRSISPASPSAGSTVTVTLTYTSSSGDKAITIHDESPYTITGTSSNIFEAARIHATQLASFTETYTFTIPAGTTGQKTFTGKYNINNQGDQVLNGASPFNIGNGGFSCTGNIPLNSQFCTGDNTGLTADTANTLVATCGAAKCEYTCSSGYHISGSTCVLDVTSCNNNNVIDSGEECDGSDLGGQTCITKGYVNGTLSCSSCKFVTSSCVSATKCEIYQTLKDGECVMAGWVWLVIGFFGLMFMMNMMPRR